ncbi:hypothetical protein Niako_4371 [Niastella koreensis GR20-10]|uniref:Uncharacterized protein n=1 Tax=Niastella koreensis (strain DSM 17620 / KACC 11465 / NBRC 106392 / GR20-10) TaxID=700598 RepID=G8TH20_NIAKG|nr:hypothetical protein Niako_4371 [Niastella koreensis GR20-10]
MSVDFGGKIKSVPGKMERFLLMYNLFIMLI